MIFASGRQRRRSLAVINLGFLSRQKLQHVVTLGRLDPELPHKPLNGVIPVRKAMLLD
jgi:hypothetical protein